MLSQKNKIVYLSPVSPIEEIYTVTTEDIQSADCILIDYELGGATAIENELAQYIRSLGYRKKLVLWSLFEKFGDDTVEIQKHYDGFILKDNLTWEALKAF